ncbi:hypothetical protein QAD02_004975 [Eretmocerus hayati]|uniref:Uncharacterized protein n=1 Tax=Eretmocerus hayati TaxID=131215 RepID=A0ACC2NS93_9HYME|nr:hypothetical protein QAD02_004975 [Eretmocerus hayati]
MDEDLSKLDLYEIIGATITASESEIKKAYRKKALSCHPDKNPDNPKAAELFLQLSKALEVLTDKAARAAYDKIVNARIQAKLRVKELDSKRKKFKDDLEAREEAFRRSLNKDYVSAQTDEEKFKAECERLKKEGSRLVEEEKQRLRQKILEDLKGEISGHHSEEACRVKIKWKANQDDPDNGGYNHENLHRFLSKHGEISELVLLSTKKGRALVEYKSREAAESAVNYERGLVTNPLKLMGMWEKTKGSQPAKPSSNISYSGSSLFPSAGGSGTKKSNVSQGLSFSSAPDIFGQLNFAQDASAELKIEKPNFESMVLDNLKRAEERKRLIEQMLAEDGKT